MSLEQQILDEYNIEVKEIKLLRHNENITYKVIAVDGEYVLRIHESVETMNLAMLIGEAQPAELLQGEMELLDILHEFSSLATQKPIKNKAGRLVTKVNDTYATLLEWVPGECVKKEDMNPEKADQIGSMVAEMHNCLKGNIVGSRYSYSVDLLERMLHFYNTVLLCGFIEKEELILIQKVLNEIKDMLEAHRVDMVLVHNDLGESNLLVHENKIIPIDFSMCGSCVKEMDLASLFVHFEDYKIKEAILKGYNSRTTNPAKEELIDICIGYQLLIFIFSQYQMIYNQDWFQEALHYWCEEVFKKILEGKKITNEIGLYS